MSNIFNESDVATSFYKALQINIRNKAPAEVTPSNVLDELVVDTFNKTYLTPADAAELALKKRLKIFQPLGIKELKDIPWRNVITPESVLGELCAAQEEVSGTQLSLTLPAGASITPKYNSIYHLSAATKGRMSSLLYDLGRYAVEAASPEHRDEAIELVRDVTKIYRTMSYSNGSMSAQIERLSQVYDVAHGRSSSKAYKGKFNENRNPSDYGYSVEKIAELLDVSMPITKLPPASHPGLHGSLSTLLVSEESAMEFIRADEAYTTPLDGIRRHKQAGPPFDRAEKGDVILEAMLLANMLIDKLATWLKDPAHVIEPRVRKKNNETMKDYKSFYDMIYDRTPYLFMGVVSPKAERYVTKELGTKVRNIINASFITHMIVSAVVDPFKHHKATAITHDTPNLMGASFTQGGMNIFIEKLLALKYTPGSVPKGTYKHYDFIYADNWYRWSEADGGTWQSLDLHKGEANVTREVMKSVLFYFLTRGWRRPAKGWGPTDKQDINLPRFSRTWSVLALEVIPTLLVDARGILGNMQIKIPGQLSGNKITGETNHAATSIYVDLYNKTFPGGEPASDERLHVISKRSGIDIKIELDNRGVISKLNNLKKLAPTNPKSTTIWPIVKFDLLGWDVSYRPNYGYVPILARDRLLPMVVIPKQNGKESAPPSQQVKRASINFAKALSSYSANVAALMTGGFAYPGIRENLEAICKHQFNVLKSVKDRYAEVDTASEADHDRDVREVFDRVQAKLETQALQEDLGITFETFFSDPLHERDLLQVMYGPKPRNYEEALTLGDLNMAGVKYGEPVSARMQLQRMFNTAHSNSATGIGVSTYAAIVDTSKSVELQRKLKEWEQLTEDEQNSYMAEGLEFAKREPYRTDMLTRMQTGKPVNTENYSRANEIMVKYGSPLPIDLRSIGVEVRDTAQAMQVIKELNGRLMHKVEMLSHVESSTLRALKSMSGAAEALEKDVLQPSSTKPKMVKKTDVAGAANPFVAFGMQQDQPPFDYVKQPRDVVTNKSSQRKTFPQTGPKMDLVSKIVDPLSRIQELAEPEDRNPLGFSTPTYAEMTGAQASAEAEFPPPPPEAGVPPSTSEDAEDEPFPPPPLNVVNDPDWLPPAPTQDVRRQVSPVPMSPPVVQTQSRTNPVPKISQSVSYIKSPANIRNAHLRLFGAIGPQQAKKKIKDKNIVAPQDNYTSAPSEGFDPSKDYITSFNLRSQKTPGLMVPTYVINTGPRTPNGMLTFNCDVQWTDEQGVNHVARSKGQTSKKMAKAHAAYQLSMKLMDSTEVPDRIRNHDSASTVAMDYPSMDEEAIKSMLYENFKREHLSNYKSAPVTVAPAPAPPRVEPVPVQSPQIEKLSNEELSNLIAAALRLANQASDVTSGVDDDEYERMRRLEQELFDF